MVTFNAKIRQLTLTPAQVTEYATFVPQSGRLVIYAPATPGDPSQLKVGDGVTALAALDFISGEAGPAGPAAAPEVVTTATISSGSAPVRFGAVRSIHRYTLSAAAALVVSDIDGETPARAGDVAVLEVSGAFNLALPPGTVAQDGAYDPAAKNVVTVTLLERAETLTASACVVSIVQTGPTPRTGLVCRQVMPNFFDDEEAALWTPAGTPATANLFSVLRDIEEYRNPDGTFRFRMVWPGLSQSWSWRQRSNPVEFYEEVEGYTFVSSTGSPNLGGFGGLALSAWPGTLLDAQINVQLTTDTFGPGLAGCIGRMTGGNLVVGETQVVPLVLFGPLLAQTTSVELYVDA